MIQGGGFELIDGKGSQKETKAPIKNEAKNGLKNLRGSISMARTNNPDSATSQFFINVVDNPGLDPKSADNPQGFSPDGYAVFGKIVDGMETIDKIRQSETGVKRMMARAPSGELRRIPCPMSLSRMRSSRKPLFLNPSKTTGSTDSMSWSGFFLS